MQNLSRYTKVCCKCNEDMNGEVLSGPYEPLEIIYECKCGYKALEIEGLGIKEIKIK